MKALYEALKILLSYQTKPKPKPEENFWQAEHDEAYFAGPPPEDMDDEDVVRLEYLGFTYNKSFDSWCCFS